MTAATAALTGVDVQDVISVCVMATAHCDQRAIRCAADDEREKADIARQRLKITRVLLAAYRADGAVLAGAE